MGQDKVCWAGSKLKMWHKPREVKQIPIQNERCVKVKGEILKIQNGIPILQNERCVKIKGEIFKIQDGIPILRSGSFF